MKTRHFSFISLMLSAPALMLLSGPLAGGCGGSSGSGNTTGGGGMGGAVVLDPNDLLSDFEDVNAATIVNAGTPARNGYWFTYKDTSPTCVTMPEKGETYIPETPPTPSPYKGGMALHARWNSCTEWGAGIGADFAQPAVPDGGSYEGLKVAYDLTGAKGITFWAATVPPGDGKLRVKVNMRAETKKADACPVPGCPAATSPPFCDEAVVGVNKCSNSWGQTFNLPPAGNWIQITVLFSDTAKFMQETWGAIMPWNPADVTGIQIQNQGSELDQPYDFYIDDVYIIR
jgi:hypothetical protein